MDTEEFSALSLSAKNAGHRCPGFLSIRENKSQLLKMVLEHQLQ
jgi:hypothetical protein